MPVIERSISAGIHSGALKIAVAKYDFAVNGGATTTIALLGQTAIPLGSTILGGWVEIDTILASSGSATAALQVNAANDVISATAFDGAPWSTTGRKAIVPVFTVATEIRTTAARDISIVIGAAALTGGVFRVILLYVDPVAS